MNGVLLVPEASTYKKVVWERGAREYKEMGTKWKLRGALKTSRTGVGVIPGFLKIGILTAIYGIK